MVNPQIEYSSTFVKQFKKLTPQTQKQAVKAEKLFKKDLFSPKLKTHKLTGERIVFEFMGKGTVLFHKIGSHDIYRV